MLVRDNHFNFSDLAGQQTRTSSTSDPQSPKTQARTTFPDTKEELRKRYCSPGFSSWGPRILRGLERSARGSLEKFIEKKCTNEYIKDKLIINLCIIINAYVIN